MAATCTVCRHAELRAIDQAILSGGSDRSIAIRFGLSRGAVMRHANAHVEKARAKAVKAATTAVVREARAAEAAATIAEAVVAQGRTTLELVEQLRDRTLAYLDQVEKAQPVLDRRGEVVGEQVDWRAVAAIVREARGCLEAQAKLLGELAPKRVELSGPGGVPLNAPPEVQAAWAAASAGDERAQSVAARWLLTGSTDPVRQRAVVLRILADIDAEQALALPAHEEGDRE